MSLSNGNGDVTVADDGTTTKSGFAGTVYDAVYAQEFPLLPDPNADAPPRSPGLGDPGFVAPSTSRADLIKKAVIAAKKVWARTALAIANAAQGTFSSVTLAAGASGALAFVPVPVNSRVIYEIRLCGYNPLTGANFSGVYQVRGVRVADAGPTRTAMMTVTTDTGGTTGTSVFITVVGNEILVLVSCSSAALTWSATLFPLHIATGV